MLKNVGNLMFLAPEERNIYSLADLEIPRSVGVQCGAPLSVTFCDEPYFLESVTCKHGTPTECHVQGDPRSINIAPLWERRSSM